MKAIYTKIPVLISLLASVSILSGCNQDAKTAQSQVKKSAVINSTVKPHAAIYMQFQLPDVIEVGQPVTVDIDLRSGRAADNLILQLRPGDGLETADPLEYAFGPQQPEQRNHLQIILQAEQDGRYRLYLTAGLVNGTGTQSRSFIIPLNIGKPVPAVKSKAVGVMLQGSDGEKIISMPAAESSD